MATITEQIVREAPEIEALKVGLIQSAKDLSDVAIDLPQQQVAALSGLQTQAQLAAQQPSGVGAYQPLLTTGRETLGTGLSTLQQAQATLQQAQAPITAATEAISGTGQLFAPSDLSAYTSPFQEAVIDTTLAELDRQAAQARNQLAARAVGGGAYGASRYGVELAELDRNLADSKARALAQLNQQNYAQALGAAQTAFENQQRRQQSQSQLFGGIAGLYGNLGGQEAGIGGQQAGIAGQQLGAGQLAQSTGLKDIAVMQQLGQEQQRQQQMELDAAQANQQRQLFEPYSRVAFLSDIYKGAPSTQTILGAQVSPPPPQPSAFQQVAGFGTGLLGTAAAAKQVGGLFG